MGTGSRPPLASPASAVVASSQGPGCRASAWVPSCVGFGNSGLPCRRITARLTSIGQACRFAVGEQAVTAPWRPL